LNLLPDGRTCPSCRERLLDSLPPVLPSVVEELSFEEWSEEGDDPSDDYQKGA